MHTCMLDLGPSPWAVLAAGVAHGSASWDGAPPLPVAVRIRGAHSRKFPKRSLQVTFSQDRMLDGPPEGHSIRRIHLNADYVDPTLMRSALSFGLHQQCGVPAPLFRHVNLTVSGDPAGLYVALESVDRDFCRRRGWAPSPIFYAVNRNANFGLASPFTKALKHPLDVGYQPTERADPAPLRDLILELNTASKVDFPSTVEQWLDVDGYLRWLMIAVFVGNRDGFVHNYALCFEQKRFRIIPWDYDATWGMDIHGRPARLDRVPLVGWNKLTHRLMEVPRYRQAYKELFSEALDGPLHPKSLHATITHMRDHISPWVAKDPLKRGEFDQFPHDVEALKTWAVRRRDLLLDLLQAF